MATNNRNSQSRKERIEYARSRSILDVSHDLGIELIKSGREYRWKEHDSFVVTPEKNLWNWFSRGTGGDVLSLVEMMKEANFNQAVDYLNDGTFSTFEKVEEIQEPFSYYLQPYEQPFEEGRSYLKEVRGLSDETIDFFLKKGVLAQATALINDVKEPVIVFKTLDASGQLVGASLQGIREDWEKWEKHGYAKQIMKNSDGMNGMHIDIGQPNRLVFAESPIDLMSYYELNKEKLSNVRLVAMDGLKDETISRYLIELQAERTGDERKWTREQLADGLKTATIAGFFRNEANNQVITLAVDNDESGRNFSKKLKESGVVLVEDFPPLSAEEVKMDWNEYLKQGRGLISEKEIVSIRSAYHSVYEEYSVFIQDNEMVSLGKAKNYDQKGSYDNSDDSLIVLSDNKKLFDILEASVPAMSFEEKIKQGIEVTADYLELANLQRTVLTNLTLRNIDGARYLQEKIELVKTMSEESERTPNSRLARSKRKLDRLEAERDGKINEAFAQQATTNGQPMNDKRGGDRFFKRHDQIDNQIYSKMDEIEEQKELSESVELPNVTRKENDMDDEDLQLDRNKREVIQDVEQQNVEEVPILSRTLSYEELTQENQRLAEQIESRIKSGELTITYSDDTYLFDIFRGLGNSHPMKSLSEERREILKSSVNILRSINDDTVDLYKKKGSPEQNELYEALKENKRFLGISDLSTRFIGEMAISAYNVNKKLESLQAETFGNHYGSRIVDIFAKSIEDVIEYPLLERADRDISYNFVTIPNSIYHYVNGQSGELVITPQTYEAIMNQVLTNPIEITPEKQQIEQGETVGVTEVETKEKAPDQGQEHEKKIETKLGDFPEQSQEAAPLPEANSSQPLNGSSPNQTRSQPLLHFSINEGEKSIHKDGYHPISKKDLAKLNRYSHNIQEAAQWYLENVADSKLTYFYQDKDKIDGVKISVDKDKFMHLTGIYPHKVGQTAEQTLIDFASGNGNFDNILIANRGAAFDKLKVLPELPAFLEVDSFYFGDLSDVPKLNSLDMDKAIKSGDEDVVLALRTLDGTTFPASLLKLRQGLKMQLDESNQERSILGIYRERNGQIEQLSINEDYIKDGGKQMLELLQTGAFEEVKDSVSQELAEVISQIASTEDTSSEELTETPYISPKQEIKNGIADRIAEIRRKNSSEKAVQEENARPLTTDSKILSGENKELLTSEEEAISTEKNQNKVEKSEDSFDYGKATAHELSKQALQKIRDYVQDPAALIEYMEFMSKFPHMSPRNAALVQIQWPGANVVATFNQWKDLGPILGLSADDVESFTRTFKNKKTGEEKTLTTNNLSVKAGEISRISLFRPVMVDMIPVLDESGKQILNNKGNPKFKTVKEASPAEKQLIKEGRLKVSRFQERDFTTGEAKYTIYKVFELSQTNLKPESYPKAIINRHYNFDVDKVKAKEVTDGLLDYAQSIGVSVEVPQTWKLGNAKGVFLPKEQKIELHPDNLEGEQIATLIHELGHATLHNPKFTDKYKEKTSTVIKELEAEMTSHLVSKHFGMDTSEDTIGYVAGWTKNLTNMTDKQLSESMKRVHKTTSQIVKHVEKHTKPFASRMDPSNNPNLGPTPGKGIKM